MEAAMESIGERSEIAFFDVETTVPTKTGQGFAILEFGAILVCPKKLVELESYSTLVRPLDLSLISSLSVRCNGISKDAVISAPTFCDIADKVYDILHGRIWAGHNILRFDCKRIKEAFAAISRPAPEPKGMIDSLVLLTQHFGRRAGDMKMASLATYFGLGQQTHRSLDDVRMNLEVLKYCAAVLFLESSLPEILKTNSWVSPNANTRSRVNDRSTPEGKSLNANKLSPVLRSENSPTLSSTNYSKDEPTGGQSYPFDLRSLSDQMKPEFLQPDVTMKETHVAGSPETSYASFLEPDEVSIPCLRASSVAPIHRGAQRIQILHEGVILKLNCTKLRVRFGLSTKFVDQAGRPRLSFVVDSPLALSKVLDVCDQLAKKMFLESCSESEWRPVVIRRNGFEDSPTVRLHIPTIVNGDGANYATEIYLEEANGFTQKLVTSRFDTTELGTLLTSGTYLSAHFSVDPYDYQRNAGIRLVAEKLIIHSV